MRYQSFRSTKNEDIGLRFKGSKEWKFDELEKIDGYEPDDQVVRIKTELIDDSIDDVLGIFCVVVTEKGSFKDDHSDAVMRVFHLVDGKVEELEKIKIGEGETKCVIAAGLCKDIINNEWKVLACKKFVDGDRHYWVKEEETKGCHLTAFINSEEFKEFSPKSWNEEKIKQTMAKLEEEHKNSIDKLDLKKEDLELTFFASCMNLRNADIIGKSDPYFIILDTHDKKQLFKSKVIKNDLNPNWLMVFLKASTFRKDFTIDDELEVLIYDKNLIGKDDYLGNFKFNLRKALQKKTGEFDVNDPKMKKGEKPPKFIFSTFKTNEKFERGFEMKMKLLSNYLSKLK